MPKITRVSHYWFFGYGTEVNPAVAQSMGLEIHQAMRATLRDHELVFSKPSPMRPGEGLVDLLYTPNAVVEGMLYEVADDGLSVLDRHFMVGRMEYRRKAMAILAEDGDMVSAAIYVGTRTQSGLRPSGAYMSDLIAGAEAQGFPEWYVEKLKSVEVLE